MTITTPRHAAATKPVDTAAIDALVARLDLEEKVALVSGADFWTTVPLEKIGLRAMVLSDGPAGVRGPLWDERSPSINLPSATALASSWDPSLAYRYGAVAAAEARRKGVDVVLGPTINLHRSPIGGRHFEAFSEDPELTGSLAAAYVSGLQDNGVAATPKHYVANDSETDRFTVDVQASERALRELYLAPFERTVTEAGTWAIMSAYNSVDGVTMSENDLLETPLNSEWGFDGIVVSDWTGVRSLGSAPASQDLAMPGPAPAWSAALVEAVRDGRVAESDVDRKVARLLALAVRVGALGDEALAPAPVDGVAFSREAETEGVVLLDNDGTLPLDAATLTRVAVIGHNARDSRTQGGGSATVLPEHTVSPLEGLRLALPEATIDYAVGAIVQEGVAELPLERLTNPRTGDPGLVATFLDADGAELFTEDRRSTALVWFGGDAPVTTASQLVLTTTYTPEATEQLRLGFATGLHGRLFVDGVLLVDEQPVVVGNDLGAALLAPPSATGAFAAQADVAVELRAEFDLSPSENGLGAISVTVGRAPDDSDPDALIAQAVEAARAADVAVVVVGTNSKVESEGWDRSDLTLPGRQDELVRAVAAVNPRTVVIVNSGAPVLLPWSDEVAAVLLGWFGGQEMGNALADVLLGVAEPGGRLSTTWAATLDDVPVLDVTPVDGVLRYEEGIHIGYRAWLRSGATPAYWFGHGLGYTSWSIDGGEVSGDVASGDARVSGTATNTGDRAGKHVVQVYAERPDSSVDRPVRWLVGSAVVRAGAGESVAWEVALPARIFAHWADGWQVEPGDVTLRIGSSVVDLVDEHVVTIAAGTSR
ncbi:beta-glucosidase [Plantibacter sp. MMLR14_011]|uniref:beta-glucosidase family protein n=1 Tax=Plantibacter sp. MMLR14_011 TaxID=1898746 RepID=UPI0008DC74A1|nr:glycoside hydrolase family 3 C-terminal domain-containing protein [Plantibacter sp. MMLR14_011]OII40120.1 glycosyl hydrolase [Plantibacter sp. MMLR14_011]